MVVATETCFVPWWIKPRNIIHCKTFYYKISFTLVDWFTKYLDKKEKKPIPISITGRYYK